MQASLVGAVVLSFFTPSAHAQVGVPANLSPTPADLTVQPGDRVSVEVFRKPELSGTLTVASDGSLEHPVYRDIQVVGLTRAQVDASIGQRIRAVEGNSPFVIAVLHKISVDGSVRTPGFHYVRADATIAEAITHAGGATDAGDLQRVQIVRNGARAEVDLAAPGVGVSRFRLQSGDAVIVPRRRPSLLTYVAPVASVITMFVSVATLLLR